MSTSKVDLEGKSAIPVLWVFGMMGASHSCSFLSVPCIQVSD